jgi:GT2 family glycosyltransferase
MPLLLSVIIPVYRDWSRLAQCLAALERQTLAADQFEIIVVNNEPGGAMPLDRLPANARVIDEAKPGSYAARNTGVAASRGEHLAFTDSDCVPEPQWLEAGLAALRARPDARITGPIPIFAEEGSSRNAYLYDVHTAFPQRDYVRQGNCVTANLLVARAVFDQVGPFDECLSGGDSLWNARATAAGVPILYDERVGVRHPARHSVADIFAKRRRVIGSRAARRSMSALPFLASRVNPPLRLLLKLLRRKLGLGQATTVFLIVWAAQFAEAKEFLLVRSGFKQPNRS